MPAKPPTLSDVARLAGVSRFVAGYVLNQGTGNTRVGEAAVAAVVKAAEKLSYRPHRASFLLRGRRSATFGLLVDSAGDPLRSFLVQHLDAAVVEAGCRLLIGNTVVGPHSFARHLEDFADRRIDGLFCAMHRTTPEQREQLLADYPDAVFYCDNGDEGPEGTNQITADLAASTQLAVRHLAEAGRKQIALALPSCPGPANDARRAGFARAMGNQALIHQGTVTNHIFAWNMTRQQALAAVDAAIEQLVRQQRVDALVVQNDYWASLFLVRLRAQGLRVPHDVAVVGHFNHYLGEWTDPPLTTVDPQPQAAARLMLQTMEALIAPGETAVTRRHLVEPRLVIRDSSLIPGQPRPDYPDSLEHAHGSDGNQDTPPRNPLVHRR